MSKQIRPTQDAIEKMVSEFRDSITKRNTSDGKINFSATLGTSDRKANLYFTELAWLKMQTLVREWSKEIAWHGLAYRCDDESKDDYIIKDILVYPQEVTGANVETDLEEYNKWLNNHDDDTYNNIRMQGHSHVNMSVTPSSVDEKCYREILDDLTDDMFYIFMIWNKSGQKTIRIYDIKKNILFETADITVLILDDGTGVEKFLAEAKEMVKDRPAATSYSSYSLPKTAAVADTKSEKEGKEKKKKYTKKETKKTQVASGGYYGYNYTDDYDDYYYGGYGYKRGW